MISNFQTLGWQLFSFMFLASKWIPPPPHIVISSRKITQIWGPIPLFWFRIEEDGLMEPPNIFENNDSFKFEKHYSSLKKQWQREK